MGKTGCFTIPGESDYEELTLQLAEKWGADIIRDSDGTTLSEDIMDAGFGVYSTVCVIRDHNAWAKRNTEKQQQTFLMAGPVTAEHDEIRLPLLRQYYEEQFSVNDTDESMKYWQVFDRTKNKELSTEFWSYDREKKEVVVRNCCLWHEYTVNFLAYRIWEEISMYNHVTNAWEKEHLMQIDPRHPETQEYLLQWMEDWCISHPKTTVVRFTSLFYNFVWIWGSSERCRNLFTDWGSYDFTVSPLALQEFEKEYGYRMTSEDFIHQGKLQATHMPSSEKKRDWIDFVNKFVVDFGRKLVDIVHSHGKKAYVFYDDSWVGMEPYHKRFEQMGFDGLIKCAFSGFEVRMCAGVKVKTHELRLHPYLFPVGLGGAPTFSEGGNPSEDARKYWVNIRRAILRQPIERIGLGGYLHLTLDFPDFNDTIEEIADEFRVIKQLHAEGKPAVLASRAAVLTDWGSLRPWTLSGHFHETYMHDLIHVNEALAGLPIEVDFIDFKDVCKSNLEKYQVIINAGRAGTAWSGGDAWKEAELAEALTEWVHEGGMFIGIGEPTAVAGYHHYFRLSNVLGVDLDLGERVCHGKMTFEKKESSILPRKDMSWRRKEGIYLVSDSTEVLEELDGTPVFTSHTFGRGRGIYMSGFHYDVSYTRLLMNLMLTSGEKKYFLTDNIYTECTAFQNSNKVVFVNNSGEEQESYVQTEGKTIKVKLKPYGICITEMDGTYDQSDNME